MTLEELELEQKLIDAFGELVAEVERRAIEISGCDPHEVMARYGARREVTS